MLPKCVSRFDGFLDDVECNGFGPRVSDWFRQVNKQRSCTKSAFREIMFGSTKCTANCCHTAESPLGRVDIDDDSNVVRGRVIATTFSIGIMYA